MPAGVNYSIERGFFPALLARGDRVLGPVHRGYWIDIGTPEKYLQVHRDILNRRFPVPLDGAPRAEGFVHPTRPRRRRTRSSTGTSTSARAARSRPARGWAPTPSSWPTCASAPGPTCATASCGGASRPGPDCEVQGSLIGPGVRLGRSSVLRNAVLGEGSVVSDYSRTL